MQCCDFSSMFATNMGCCYTLHDIALGRRPVVKTAGQVGNASSLTFSVNSKSHARTNQCCHTGDMVVAPGAAKAFWGATSFKMPAHALHKAGTYLAARDVFQIFCGLPSIIRVTVPSSTSWECCGKSLQRFPNAANCSKFVLSCDAFCYVAPQAQHSY